MRPFQRGWTIVLAGAWNPAILNPQWIGRHILKVEKVPVEVTLAIGAAEQMQVVFRDQQFLLATEPGRILVSPLAINPEALRMAEFVAIEILRTLEHTPVTAAGINYVFRSSQPVEAIDAVFNLADSGRLVAMGLTKTQTEIVRQLSGVPGHGDPVLNLKFSSRVEGEAALHVDFNYHYAVGSAREAADRLSGAFSELAAHATALLQQYGVNVEDEEDTHE